VTKPVSVRYAVTDAAHFTTSFAVYNAVNPAIYHRMAAATSSTVPTDINDEVFDAIYWELRA
jgi:hypothetical protein